MSRDRNEAGQVIGVHNRAPVVAALDLGHSKIACFIMKPEGVRHADRTVRVAGASHVQSRGIKGGSIVNMDEAAQAIGHAVERAERAAGAPVSGVIVSTAIGQTASHRVQARVSLGANPVGDADLARAIATALAQIRLPNRRPIHVLPVAWSVDGSRGVRDPRAMRGASLGLDLLVVSMAEGGGDDDARDGRARGALGALDGVADGLGRLVHVDDGAALDAARLDVAGAGDAHRAVGVAHALGLHDEAGDLGVTQIQRGHHRRAVVGADDLTRFVSIP